MENPLLTSDTLALKELFNEPLYLIKEEFNTITSAHQSTADSKTELDFSVEIEGDNTKNIIFIVFSDNPNLSEMEKSLFDKTISALKLSPSEIGFTSLSNNLMMEFESLSLKLPNQRVVCYGNSKMYDEKLLQIMKTSSSSFLLCPSLDELASNNDLKIKWWGNLKAFLNQ